MTNDQILAMPCKHCGATGENEHYACGSTNEHRSMTCYELEIEALKLSALVATKDAERLAMLDKHQWDARYDHCPECNSSKYMGHTAGCAWAKAMEDPA
jgi:hypothetical protein